MRRGLHNPVKPCCESTLNIVFSVMVFYVTMVTFQMTILMNKFTTIVMDDE